MLREAASWQGSSHSLLLLLRRKKGTRSAETSVDQGRRRLGGVDETYLLNLFLVSWFQGPSFLSDGADIAAGHESEALVVDVRSSLSLERFGRNDVWESAGGSL